MSVNAASAESEASHQTKTTRRSLRQTKALPQEVGVAAGYTSRQIKLSTTSCWTGSVEVLHKVLGCSRQEMRS